MIVHGIKKLVEESTLFDLILCDGKVKIYLKIMCKIALGKKKVFQN
jgi:hypothetical protein